MFNPLKIYSNYNVQILNLVDGECFILDIGCGDGSMAREIKKKNNSAVVYGIDISNEALEKASSIDKFFILDLDVQKIPEFEKKFDLIILGDVLEHLKRPDLLMAVLRSLLNENGKIIVSVPNIAYFRIRLGLLFGKFEYGDSGIMDNSHLRFFTYNSIKSLFSQTGYKVEQERFIYTRKLNFLAKKIIFFGALLRLISVQLVFKLAKV